MRGDTESRVVGWMLILWGASTGRGAAATRRRRRRPLVAPPPPPTTTGTRTRGGRVPQQAPQGLRLVVRHVDAVVGARLRACVCAHVWLGGGGGEGEGGGGSVCWRLRMKAMPATHTPLLHPPPPFHQPSLSPHSPTSRRAFILAAPRATAMTRAPITRPSCTAARPTPPAAPSTNRVCPGRRSALSLSAK